MTAEGYGVTDADSAGEEFSGLSPQVQRSTTATDDSVGEAPESVREVVNSPGQSLDSGVRRRMESTMGENFGDVAVHTGSTAAQSTDDVNARAYTVGSDVVFDSGEYAPGTPEGDRVIAHELAHVAQQSRGTPRVQRQGEGGVQTQGGGYTEMTAEYSPEEFVDQKFAKIWAEVNSVIRSELDVSGTPEQGKIPVRLFGKLLYVSSLKRDLYKREKEPAKQLATGERVDASDSDDLTEAERDLIRHQQGTGELMQQSVEEERRSLLPQSAFQQKARKEVKDETGRTVDATLAAIADEITDEVVTEKRVREEFQRDSGTRTATDTPRKRISKRLTDEVKREVLSDTSWVKNEALDRLDSDEIARRAIATTEKSAADAFGTIRNYLERLDSGESTSIRLRISISTPDSPVSATLTGSLSASRDTDGSLSLDGMIKFNVDAGAKIVTGGFGVRKLVRSGGSSPRQATLALSYALYRHYVGLGTEWLANRLWGAGQEGSDSYQLKAQRWAAAAESRLSEGDFGMVGYGAEVNLKAGGDVGVAGLLGKIQQTADTFELYDSRSIQNTAAYDSAGNIVAKPEDSDGRRRREKESKSLTDVQEYNTKASFTTRLGGGGASVAFSLSAGYKYNTSSREHSFTLSGSFQGGGIAGVAADLAEKLYTTARSMRKKADHSGARDASNVEFDQQKLQELLAGGVAGALSNSVGSGSGGVGISLERTVSPSGSVTTLKLFRASREDYTVPTGYVDISLRVSKNRVFGKWTRPDGGEWKREF